MSKKKATMTLKDFHGGSIPSDLPLPSAPGVNARPADRGGFDRQTSWGNSIGRSDNRLRPASAGSARNLDDKTSFLSYNVHIGRNFDEDERKPLDGAHTFRQTVIDEPIRAQPSRKIEPRMGSQTGSVPVSKFSMGSTGSNYPTMSGNEGQAVASSYPNAWGIKKDTSSVKDLLPAPWSAPDAATKLAHASALEKVSSGRWNPKQQVHLQQGPEFSLERSLVLDEGVNGGVKERVKPNVYQEATVNDSRFQSLRISGKSVGNGIESAVESSERPKLKLLPRSKPLENLEASVDHKQGFQHPIDHLQVQDGFRVVREATNVVPSGLSDGDRVLERPKLNLKPRSQPHEDLEGKSGVKRCTVFGGARPQELVLKERGVDEVAVSNASQLPFRVKEDAAPKNDPSIHTRHNEKSLNFPGDQKIVKYIDRRDQPLDGDLQRRNRRTENRRNNTQQIHERSPSPETWRKPVEEHPKVEDRKPSSALELAQAFSRSVLDPTMAAQKGVSGRVQMPFSRLMGPTTRPQINGY